MEPGRYRALVDLTLRIRRSNGLNDPTEVACWSVEPGEEFEIPKMVNRHYMTVNLTHGDPYDADESVPDEFDNRPSVREGIHYARVEAAKPPAEEADPGRVFEEIHEKIGPLLDRLRLALDAIDYERRRQDGYYLSKAVRSLKYFEPEDEGGELFRATCGVAYQLYGIDENWRSMLLAYFAWLQAKNAEEHRSVYDNDDDFEMGVWGYA